MLCVNFTGSFLGKYKNFSYGLDFANWQLDGPRLINHNPNILIHKRGYNCDTAQPQISFHVLMRSQLCPGEKA